MSTEEVKTEGSEGGNKFMDLTEELPSRVTEIMQSVIGDEKYDIDKISTWCTEISTKVIEYLQSVLPQYRFGLNIVIAQKRGNLHSHSSCYCNQKTDGSRSAQYSNETVHAITCVYGFSLY